MEAALLDATQWRQGVDGAEVGVCLLDLQGVTCAACAPLIEAAARAVPGVIGLKVHAAAQRAELQWDRHQFRWPVFAGALERIGYGAVPAHSGELPAIHRRERKALLWRLFVAWFCAMQVMMLATPSYVAEPGDIPADLDRLLTVTQWVMTIPALFFTAGPFLTQAWVALRRGQMAMEVPVAVAVLVLFTASTAAAFEPQGVWGAVVWFDSLTMFLAFLLTARWFDQQTRHAAAREVDALRGSATVRAQRWTDQGQLESVDARSLHVGDRIRVIVGERIPADGTVLWGETEIGESLLTGESLPVTRRKGDSVLEGGLNVGGAIDVEVTHAGGMTRRQQLVQLAEQAALERPPMVQAADRWAGPFLGGVLVLAAGAGLVWWFIDPSRAVGVAVAVLVVTCPCALALAAPTALLTAARVLAQQGVVVRRIAALEALASIQAIVFDKTGTLTQDRLTVDSTHWARPTAGVRQEEVLQRVVQLAQTSRHPASLCLLETLGNAAGGMDAASDWVQVREVVGRGVEGIDRQGRRWRLGRPSWIMETCGLATGGLGATTGAMPESLTIAVSLNGVWQLGWGLNDPVRAVAPQVVAALRQEGVAAWILSGDSPERTQRTAAFLQVAVLAAAALPEQKLEAIRRLQDATPRVAMVGDGINDVPVLAAASVSLAMGHGSSEALAQADFLVLDGRLDGVITGLRTARAAVRVIRQNFAWAMGYNAVAVPLAVLGQLPPWLAGLGMACSSLIVLVNSQRLRTRFA